MFQTQTLWRITVLNGWHLADRAIAGFRQRRQIRVVLAARDAVGQRHRVWVRLLERETLRDGVLADHLQPIERQELRLQM